MPFAALLGSVTARMLPGLLLTLANPTPAMAWLLEVSPGPRTLYLQVGNGLPDANLSTVNLVSGSVPATQVGDGIPLQLSSNSTAAQSHYDGYTVCNPPRQVYVGAYFRFPSSSTSRTAVLQVSSPSHLVSGGDVLPMSSISWISSANGDSTPHVPSGTFSGGVQVLRVLNANTWVENCLTFDYANATVPPAGTYAARVIYSIAMP